MHKDVFVVLAAVAWADGQLHPDEADAIVRAAAEVNLSLEEIVAIEEATRRPVDLGIVDQANLSKSDRLFVYAIACWITRIDGRVTDEETATLGRLAERLGIPERARTRVAAAVREVASWPEGDRPARYDLLALRRILGEWLTARAS